VEQVGPSGFRELPDDRAKVFINQCPIKRNVVQRTCKSFSRCNGREDGLVVFAPSEDQTTDNRGLDCTSHRPEEKRVRMVFTTASLSVLVLAKTPARKQLETCALFSAIQVVQFSPDKQFRVVTAP
jgi:hypothetical protein